METKKCDFCAEEILFDAKKCKHCGEIVDYKLRSLKETRERSQPIIVNGSWNPGVAAVLSFFIPGLGQLYKGHLVYGFMWFVFVAIGYALLIVPGVIIHIMCILNAISSKR